MRPLFRPVIRTGLTTPAQTLKNLPSRRTFLPDLAKSLAAANAPGSTPGVFSATRTLPYPSPSLYKLISDIDSYHTFIPYCINSTVTKRSPPPQSSPVEADLRVGFSGFDETFRSRVKCTAPSTVEADASDGELFQKLSTRWEIHPRSGSDKESTVSLKIEFGFNNPVYAALTQAVAPKVAGKLIDAFERRAREVLSKELEGDAQQPKLDVSPTVKVEVK